MKTGKKLALYFAAALVVTGAAFAASLAVGRYPIDWAQLAADGMDRRVFFTLRLPRTCMALLAGFALGIAGGVYQTVFQNPLAAPDIIGVSSGASAGARPRPSCSFGGGVTLTALLAFAGGMTAVLAVLALAGFVRQRGVTGIVLAGIAVNALTQSMLMLMKLTADPEKQLAAIEFWTMGSFADVTMQKLLGRIAARRREGFCACFCSTGRSSCWALGKRTPACSACRWGRCAARCCCWPRWSPARW